MVWYIKKYIQFLKEIEFRINLSYKEIEDQKDIIKNF